MNYYKEIKENLINNEIYKRVKDYSKNRSDLDTYYKVGRLLHNAGKHYVEGIIKKYSKKLTEELGKGYTFTSLTRMKKFYLLIEKVATVSQQLSYGYYVELLPIKDINKINYYIRISEKESLSIRQLSEKIKIRNMKDYPKKTKDKLIKQEKINIKDLIPNPIVIKNRKSIDVINEKVLHKLILEDIETFMKELRNNYAFIGSEYKINIDKYKKI